MSRMAHPNVVSLLAARVLPPGAPPQHNSCVLYFTVDAIHTAICSLLHASYPKAYSKILDPSTLHLLYKCYTCHEHGNTLQLCCADYMLVMELEGDNLAHKLHQEVNRVCSSLLAPYRGLV